MNNEIVALDEKLFHDNVIEEVPELIYVMAKYVVDVIEAHPEGLTRREWVIDNIALALSSINDKEKPAA